MIDSGNHIQSFHDEKIVSTLFLTENNMEEQIKILEAKVSVLSEVVMWLILLQDRIVQFRLRKAYPELDRIMKQHNL